MCMLICCELRSTGTFVREDPGCLFHGGPTLLRPQPLTTLLTTIPCGQKSLWINEGSQTQNTGKAFLLCFRQDHVRAGTRILVFHDKLPMKDKLVIHKSHVYCACLTYALCHLQLYQSWTDAKVFVLSARQNLHHIIHCMIHGSYI